jgi:hypothetical protein
MFTDFSKQVTANLDRMYTYDLFVADVEDIFGKYLSAFPSGSNPIFRERTAHDCNCCKQFIRNMGNLVAFEGDAVLTVWDNYLDLPFPYNEVAKRMRDFVVQAPVKSVFLTKEMQYSHDHNRDNHDESIIWHHFWTRVKSNFVAAQPDAFKGKMRAKYDVLKRGLEELTYDSLNNILALIDDNNLYRGEEHRAKLVAFMGLYRKYQEASLKDAYVWQHINDFGAYFRNEVIGTLAIDLSAGVEMEHAVRMFESKVAPLNYKRTKSLITPVQIDKAIATLKELGLEEAVSRRYARLNDISVNNVLFVDNATQGEMKDGLRDLLMETVPTPRVDDLKNAAKVGIDEFMSILLPKIKSLKTLVENKHLGNFVSLTAPQRDNTGRLFKWNNDFAWSYSGDVTDSIKERVKAAGGKIDAHFRVSLSWFNGDDLDLHCKAPMDRHIYFGNKMGILDVDMNAGAVVRDPVENMAFGRDLWSGAYEFYVNNYRRRESVDVGFIVEVEYEGKIYSFTYDKPVFGNISVCRVEFSNGKLISLKGGNTVALTERTHDKWGVKTQSLVDVSTIMYSPNFWDGQTIGNKHWFFMLKDCRNPEPTRGIYNEYLRGELEPHRKVFEILGAKTMCVPTDDQLSGIGFSSTKRETLKVIADGRQTYEISF